MKPRLVFATLLAAGCFGASPSPVSVLADRILKLAEQEPIASAIDTRLRAAQLLMPVEPDLGKKFLSSGMELLQAHPEVQRNRNITACILAMDVPGGDKVLLAGNDRVEAYNQLLWHWASRGETRRAAVALQSALHDSAVTDHLDKLWGAGRVLGPLSVSEPKEAAALFVELAHVKLSQNNLVQSLAKMQTSFLQAPPDKAADVVAALRLLVPVISDPAFAETASSAPPVKREFGGQMVDIHTPREAQLFGFGAIVHVLAPNVYEESHTLFEPWDRALRSIDTRQKIASLYARPPQTGNSAPPIDFKKAPLPEALAGVEKISDANRKIDAYDDIVLRSDTTPEQRTELAERVRKLLRAQIVAGIEKGNRDSLFFYYVAKIQRRTGITLDSDDPSLKAQQALLDLEEAIQPGYDFVLPETGGKLRKLSDELGKVVIVNFWATWCPPCRAEMPLLAKLSREWGSKGLSILAISDETPDDVTSYERQFHYNLPVLLDPARKVFDHYRVQGIPDTRILDRSGRVVASFGELLSEEEVVRALHAAGLQ